MKEDILNYLKDIHHAREVHDLMAVFHIEGKDAFRDFMKLLNTLEEEHLIVRDEKNHYYLLEQHHDYIGKIHVHKKGFAFVELGEDQEDYYISKEDLHGAFDGDQVLIHEKKRQKGERKEAVVKEILKREKQRVVGEIISKKDRYFIQPDDQRMPTTEVDLSSCHGAMPGHKVVANIISYHPFKVDIEKILGHRHDPGVDILSIVESYDVNTEFKDDIYAFIDDIPSKVLEEEKEGRVDFRDRLVVTVDGEDARDFDDAISLKRKNNGDFELDVHIADVSHYVQEGSILDKEAFERGTSIYLTDRVIPMLPHKLSNGICSLNEGVDRLTISCLMDIDQHTGEVLDHRIVPGLIRSSRRMTYTKVNQILAGNKKICQAYQDVAPMFLLMEELAEILRKKRKKKGAIDFDVDEAKIIVDEQGKAKDVVLRSRGISEHIIEEFMLVANETIAQHFKWLDVPFIYRVHEKPKVKKLQKFMQVAGPLGYHLKGSLENIYPKDLDRLLNTSKNQPEYKIISTLLLRCMQKARYDAQCLGHFGLADEYYTHFTSPIRRYPDLIVHRLIRRYLFEGKLNTDTINHYQGIMDHIAEHTSNSEYTAVNLERDVMAMKMAEYMEKHIGEVFEGMISSITNFGFFVELDNTINGLVHITSLKDDYYTFNEVNMTMVGERTGRVFRMSDTVKVKCVAVSKEEGTIDFEVVGLKKTRRSSLPTHQNFIKKVKTRTSNHSKMKIDTRQHHRKRRR